MALKAKSPEAVEKRLKLFVYGPAGVGKSTAAIQFPKAYIIDAEKGTSNYDELIKASGSVVLHTNDMMEVIAEVKELLTAKHEYRTLVIDPITTLYNDLLDKSEKKVGSDFGKHYGAANKEMKRLANLIMALDMNVIVTSHAKKEYGDNLKVTGQTFDGWRNLDYWFDLVLELRKDKSVPPKRFARVAKTRISKAFPDEDVFEWSYDNFKKRYGADLIERVAAPVVLASEKQVADLKELLSIIRLPEGTTEKWLNKAGVDDWEDMPADAMAGCLKYLRARLPGESAAA